MTREEAVKMLQATRLMLMDGANQPISDLYYALDMAIEALADRKTENSSEIPNNSTISKMEQVEDEPQTSCKTCRFGEVDEGYVKCAYYSKATEQDEPKTERSE